MRREVRLLGDILGEVIRDSAGPELLADVERLRHAVIDARNVEGWAGGDGGREPPVHGRGGRGDDADAPGDEITKLVASWSLEAAEQVARAFAVYFHLANLAEEHQRIRNLRERDTGQEPVRESLAAAAAEIRRGGARWWPRCAGSAGCSTCWTTSAPRRRTGTRPGASCASRSICSGERRS